MRTIATTSVPQPSTALTLLRNNATRRRLTMLRPCSESQSESQKADCEFELGLGITEIAGSAGCGKTQIALGVCVACACTPFKTKAQDSSDSSEHAPFGKALFVSLGEGTTKPMIAKRLFQMAETRKAEHLATNTNTNTNNNLEDQTVTSVLNRILTRFIRNQDEFELFVFHELHKLLEKDQDIAFIAMDSIASMFRASDGKHSLDAAERSGLFFRVAAQLKKLSEHHLVPFLIVNQVTADFESKEGNAVRPALGLSWANCVNESYLLSRNETTQNEEAGRLQTTFKFRRTIRCRFSPCHYPGETSFIIDVGGAKSLSPKTTHTLL